jgi:hypothetical protein
LVPDDRDLRPGGIREERFGATLDFRVSHHHETLGV